MSPLNIVDISKPYNIHVDTSNHIWLGAVVSYSDENGAEKPIAFASEKLNKVGQPLKRNVMLICGRCKNTEIGYLVLKLLFIRITIRSPI